MVTEGYNLNRTKSELWVTSIRDPVDRLWSSFKYEGRWQLARHAGQSQYEQSFLTWHAKTNSSYCTFKTWQCSANCFTKWFSGCTSGLTQTHFANAVKNLAQFDVVINVHLLKNLNYMVAVQKCLNLTFPLTHSLPRWMGRQAAEANLKHPLAYPERRPLVNANALDYKLLKPYWSRHPCPHLAI